MEPVNSEIFLFIHTLFLFGTDDNLNFISFRRHVRKHLLAFKQMMCLNQKRQMHYLTSKQLEKSRDWRTLLWSELLHNLVCLIFPLLHLVVSWLKFLLGRLYLMLISDQYNLFCEKSVQAQGVKYLKRKTAECDNISIPVIKDKRHSTNILFRNGIKKHNTRKLQEFWRL